MKNKYFIFFLLLLPVFVFSHESKIDSLLAQLKTDHADSNKVKHLNAMARECSSGSPDTAMILSSEALQLSQKINWPPGIGQSYHQLGRFYNLKGDYSLSLQFYYKALDIWNQIENGYKQNKASTLGNIGIVYWSQGDSPKALDFYLKALKIDEELGIKKLIASVLSNIGILYTQEKEYEKALDYYLKALKMEEELDNKELIANTLSNIGTVYYEQKDFQKALDYYLKALKIGQELGDKNGIANWLSGIGNVYAEQKNYPEALAYFLKALNMTEALGDKNGMAMHLINIGSLYIKTPSLSSPIGEKKKGLSLAEDYLQRALAISDKNGYLFATQECNEHLSELYQKMGNFGKALEHYKKAMAAKDSLFNADKNQEITRKAMTFEFEKKENDIKAEQDKKDAVAEADKKKQKIIVWSVLVGLFLVIVFAGFIFRSLRITRKQKNIIEDQKQLVEEHQKEILDSIHYAKRIQRALLASDNLLKKNLPEFFVLYKPKDIVSGDFYWALQTNGHFLVLTGDCTGHGVPGAFMSLLNVSFLNEAAIEKKISSPDLILNHVREKIISALNPEGTDTEGKDGMDCILCSFDFKKNILEIACANNPLWIVRGETIIEYKPDKMPVGMWESIPSGQTGDKKNFTLQRVELQKGDIVYAFTDGYADQFGGPKGKKFKYKHLQEKLLSMIDKPMAEQKNTLEKIIDDWKGNLEQVDDILLIGVRI